MDPAFVERNRAQRERLWTIATRLSKEELARPIDGPWTPAALLAHVAFWDRFVHARWVQATRGESRMPQQIDDAVQDLINDAALPQWTRLPPGIAVEEALAAAEAVDTLIGSLDADIVAEVLAAGRERLVDRSLHRSEHLDTIAAAFPPG